MDNMYDAVMQRVQFRYVPGAVSVTEEMIRGFEREIGHELPAEYRHFLAKYGFACGEGHTCYGDAEHDGQAVWENSVGAFYGLGGNTTLELRHKLHVYRHLELPMHLLPIAGTELGHICLSLAGPDAGCVYEWIATEEYRTGDPEYDQRLVAPDFDTFINSLQRVEGKPPGG